MKIKGMYHGKDLWTSLFVSDKSQIIHVRRLLAGGDHSAFIGSRKVNMLPSPGELFTEIVPP